MTGFTPNELARLLRVSPDKVRLWIKRGELSAIDTAPSHSRKPRFIVLPVHLEEFQQRRRVKTAAPKPARRRRQPVGEIDFYP